MFKIRKNRNDVIRKKNIYIYILKIVFKIT